MYLNSDSNADRKSTFNPVDVRDRKRKRKGKENLN